MPDRDDKLFVVRAQTQPVIDLDEQTAARLLNLLDSRACRRKVECCQTRKSERRRLRVPCRIRFLARDRTTVLETTGKTRDISRTGLGLLCQRHLAKNTIVHVVVQGPDRKDFNLTGVVMHSRALQEGWYFVGMKFQKLPDDPLAQKPDAGPAQ